MSAKTMITLGLKMVALTIILFACFAVAPTISGIFIPPISGGTQTDAVQAVEPESAAVALLVVCAFQAVVLSYPIIRSRWTGWRLVITMFFVHYGVMTFLSQIETVLFLNYLVDVVPAEMIPALFLEGAIVAALFSPLAVLIHGKMKRSEEPQGTNQRLVMPWTEWVWKLVLIAVVYVIVYFSFGWLVFMPLAGEAFQSYYGELQGPAWILPLQMVRGIMWTALALPVIQMMKGKWWEAGLAVGLLFSVLMGFLLLIPNGFMPDAIRRAHWVEVSSSNFLFGWIVVGLFHRHYGSVRNLFRRSEGLETREVSI
jgi:hypothetical protein